MKKHISVISSVVIVLAVMFGVISCKDNFLSAPSLSSVDENFVFSTPSEVRKVMAGEYELWQRAYYDLFYALDVPGSDITHHPECYSCQIRSIPEGLYAGAPGSFDINWDPSVKDWAPLYKIANRANLIMEAIAKKKEYQNAVAAKQPNDWTQLYGEAAVHRAFAYFNLIRYWGDVPYFTQTIRRKAQTDSAKLTSRFKIYDGEIANLEKVAPLMYNLGENGINAERYSRQFAEGLIGKMALYASGYSLLRTDGSVDYGNISFKRMGSTDHNAEYAEPTGSKQTDYLKTAQKYLKMLIDNPGSAHFISTDPRGKGYDNPFQYNFQENMDLVVDPASVYEIAYTRGVYSERPYSFGRPSGGGNSNCYPCKSYGQDRIDASFYYGWYSPKDLRRDVTVAVTANSGSDSEVLIDFSPGSRNKGGLALNKWDEVRMSNPYTAAKRASGINWPIMRMDDVYLMLAEVDADLNDEGDAKTYLTEVRSRAFMPEDRAKMVTEYVGGLSGQSLKDAIIRERALEFAGEGFRRYDLIRTGKLPQAIKDLRQRQNAMINGLESKGYYTFPNGQTISNYIWTKMVSVADYGMSKMLTTECEVDSTDPTYPIRFPGWRGNSDLWGAEGFTASDTLNLAIKGLFHYIDPNGAEAAALEAQGYVKTPWAINIVKNKAEYTVNLFKGYTDYSKPPIYLLPLSSETIAQSNGLITNGYGFSQQ